LVGRPRDTWASGFSSAAIGAWENFRDGILRCDWGNFLEGIFFLVFGNFLEGILAIKFTWKSNHEKRPAAQRAASLLLNMPAILEFYRAVYGCQLYGSAGFLWGLALSEAAASGGKHQ
jgi:hypothetical protein